MNNNDYKKNKYNNLEPPRAFLQITLTMWCGANNPKMLQLYY